MTRALGAERVPPLSGEARSAVVFLHGYGANGRDLIGLAEPLAPYLPDTVFLSPDAPEPCVGAPMGLQWFPIPWIDGSTEAAARAGLGRALADLQAYLDRAMAEEGLAPAQVLLFGFSQGTMMALHAAPRRAEPLAGVVAFSGRLLEPGALAREVASRPPVLLVHGDRDDVVPVAALREAVDGLTSAGWSEVHAHVMRGTAHGIAPDGLEVALAFVRERLDPG